MTGTFLGLPSVPTAPPGVGHLSGSRGFPEAATEALADGQLRRNLAAATATIRAKRAQAVGELPDWLELRAAAAAVKDDVLANLDTYLVQLEEQVTARGGVVHWARDAAEANRIVTEIVQATGAREVVKVKSMATQEIGLNEALADAGISAWETDLAELIVQLGDDQPSHILVPAIHRNRTEIRDVFVAEMGKAGVAAPDGLTDEPAALAEAARRHLRARFLDAEVAVSGANFAVAETGTLAVVESEGNGRMCLTLPRVLVTVMGIEKVVPTWRDLEIYLQVLPAVQHGRADEPVHLDVDRRDPRRRPAGVPPRAARQRPHRDALGPAGALGAALHPVLGVPERLPGLRADRWARVRLRLPRPDRRGALAAAHRGGRERDAAVRLDAVRRLLRGVPRGHRHPDDARPPAGESRCGQSGSPPRAGWRAGADDLDRLGDEQPAALAVRAPLRPRRSRARSQARPDLDAAAAAVGVDGEPRPAPSAEAELPRLVDRDAWWPSMSAREEVLGRVRQALADRPAPLPAERTYRLAGSSALSVDALVEQLAERLVDYRAVVHHATGDTVAARGRCGARRSLGAARRRAGRLPLGVAG